MRKPRKQQRPLTTEQAEEAVKRHNFWRALEMLCTKVGKAKEFHWYIRRRDPDATIGQITEFRRKMVRLLSFNYDVHRRPNPNFSKKLLPSGTPGAEPLSYPPEWREQ